MRKQETFPEVLVVVEGTFPTEASGMHSFQISWPALYPS